MKKMKKMSMKNIIVKLLSVLLLFGLIFSLYQPLITAADDRPWTETFPYQKPDGYDLGNLSHVISVVKEDRKDSNGNAIIDVKIVLNTDSIDGIEFKEGGRLVLGLCDFTVAEGYINWTSIPRNTDGKKTIEITLSGLVTNKETAYLTFSTLEYPETGNDPVTGEPFKTIIRGYIWDLDTGSGTDNGGNWIPDPGITPIDPPTTEEPKEIASLKPHVIIDKYSFGQDTLGAGQSIKLNFTLRNTSKRLDAENLIIVISTTDDLSIKSGANTIHIPEIKRGSASEQSVSLKLKVNTTQDVQKVTITTSFEYFDKKETDPVAGEDSIEISVPSSKITRAKVSNITTVKKFKQRSEGAIEFGVINNGFSKLNNVEAFITTLEGEELAWRYLGTLEGGTKSEAQKVPLTFLDFGKKDLLLLVKYEDENLTPIEIQKDFFVEIEEVPEEPDIDEPFYPPTDPEIDDPSLIEPEGLSVINKILIGVGVAVALLIIIMLIIKSRKKKKDSFDDFFDAFPKTDIGFDDKSKDVTPKEKTTENKSNDKK